MEFYDLSKLWKVITEQTANKIGNFWRSITRGHVGLTQTVTVEYTWDILKMKKFIKKHLPDSKISISNIIERLDNGKVVVTAKWLKEQLLCLWIDIANNSNISKESLDKKELYRNPIQEVLVS